MGRATGQRFVELGISTDLDFDVNSSGNAAASSLQRRSDTSRGSNVVIFDQHRVIQAHPMVHRAAR